jgi:hypothetical protein
MVSQDVEVPTLDNLERLELLQIAKAERKLAVAVLDDLLGELRVENRSALNLACVCAVSAILVTVRLRSRRRRASRVLGLRAGRLR